MLSPGFFKTQGSWGWRCHCPNFPLYRLILVRRKQAGNKEKKLVLSNRGPRTMYCCLHPKRSGHPQHPANLCNSLGWSQSTCFRQRFPCQLPNKPSALTNLHLSQMFNLFGHWLTELSYNWVPGGCSLSGDVYPSLSVKTTYNSDFMSLSANKNPEVSPSTLLLNSKTV